jgi:Xaa-Pro aminopeptidase
LDAIRILAFQEITTALRSNAPLTEYDLQQHILQEFKHRSLIITNGEPIVAVNANSRLPHYFPTPDTASLITENSWILLDIWGKHTDPDSVYADITWVAFTGQEIPAKQQEIFDIVITARDRVITKLQQAWQNQLPAEGWELDRAVRDYITEKGYGDSFIHTTGHSLDAGESVHAKGVSLNDVSAHDTRAVLPGSAITIEPGIYVEDFGVRTEIDVYIDPKTGPIITTELQTTIPILI